MTKVELRTSKKLLEDEKSKLDKERIRIGDQRNAIAQSMATLRAAEFSHQESKQALMNKESNKPARQVIDNEIKNVRIEIQKVEKELEKHNKDFMVVDSKIKALEGSIRELSQA